MALRSVPALWELYEGKTFVGFIEKMYSGEKPWSAVVVDEIFEVGRYRTRREAERAVARRLREIAKKSGES